MYELTALAQAPKQTKCDYPGCPEPAQYHVSYPYSPGEQYNMCEEHLNKKDEKGREYYRYSAQIIPLELVPSA